MTIDSLNSSTPIYYTHIFSILKYLITIQSNGSNAKINEIKKQQNKDAQNNSKKSLSNKYKPTIYYNEQFHSLVDKLIKLDQIILIYNIENNFIRHSNTMIHYTVHNKT